VLGDIAGGEYARNAGLHPVIDEHASVDRQARHSRELDIGPDANSGKEHVAGKRCAVLQPDRAGPIAGRQAGRSGAVTDLDAQRLEMGVHELAASCVDLLAQQALATLEHRHAQAKLVQRMSGLEPEQAGTSHDGGPGAVLLDLSADRHRVPGLPHDESAW